MARRLRSLYRVRTQGLNFERRSDIPVLWGPPFNIRFQAHSPHANDIQVARSKNRAMELEIKKKGMDLAFTEWMQRDHPYVFAKECVKEVGEMAIEYRSTPHMLEFDKLIEKRADLRIQAGKYGHDIAFAEWLRAERPDVYRQRFGIKPDQDRKK